MVREQKFRRGPGQRAGLGREQVLAAARELLSERGLAGLTMRGLAARLGVAPNALYSHVADKADLVDLVLDDVLGAVPLPAAGAVEADPLTAVRALMLASYDVLLTRADLMPHFLARQGARGEHAQQLGLVMLDALGRAGVEEQASRDAMRVLIVNTIGFAAFATLRDASFLGSSGQASGPVPAAEIRSNYVRALDWLLAGITSG